MTDIFESNISLLKEYYIKENYKVIVLDESIHKTLICFSSHALYYPFTEEAFKSIVIERNKYDYTFLINEPLIRGEFGKIVFCRDLYREWYVNGIDLKHDSINKVIDLLLELTRGDEVVTLGTSSGGYMATIVGVKLSASAVYSMSGQFSLKQWKDRRYLSMYIEDNDRSQYYDIVDMVGECNVSAK